MAAGTDYFTGGLPLGVALGDVNGDGRLDVVTANSNGQSVSVLLGLPGGFAAKTDYATGGGSGSVALGDGQADLVASPSNAVAVLLGLAGGGFGAAATHATGNGPHGLALGNVDNDGRPGIVTTNYGASTASVLLNSTVFPVPTLTGVGPGAAPAGTRITLTGTHLSSTRAVSFNGTNAPGFAVRSPTALSVTVPPGATSGSVRVSIGGGTSNALPFAMSPLATAPAQAAPGAPVLFPVVC